ncbi:hypothetical protein IJJ27_02215 [bacterium]|nr:hypothetical protein [bacterium]
MPNNAGRTKEYLIVIGLGLLVAFGVTLFLYYHSSDNLPPQATPTPTPAPITELPDKKSNPLTLDNLENESVFDTKSLTITGHTFPNLPVVIFINQKNFITDSDEFGNFSFDVNLESGSNLIQVTSVDQGGQSYSQERLVIYTNKSLDEILLTDEELKNAQSETPAE